MTDVFYRAFEERYYATREVIKTLRRQYLPFVEPFKGIGSALKVFDIGCGRGEWLELMIESGFDACGMDLDEGMLEACYMKGLPGEKGDAVKCLMKLKDKSHAVISAFHVVEHLSLEYLHVVVREALRVLIPGGLLIVETPNPENINVATKNFYLDPTHQRPIPPELMSFLSEYYGFKRVKILRLNESKNLTGTDSQNLYDVINGVSPDYSVIAQKAAPKKIMAKFDQAFNKEYGVSLENLAAIYDKKIISRENRIKEKAMSAEARAKAAETRAASAEARALAAENRARKAEILAVSAKEHSHQAENGVKEALNLLQSVYASWSWRITAPARWLAGLLAAGFSRPRHQGTRFVEAGIRVLRGPFAGLVNFVLSHPDFSSQLRRQLLKYPWLYQQILGVTRRAGLLSCDLPGNVFQNSHTAVPVVPTLARLTPQARRIYHDLKSAMEKERRTGSGADRP